jgi:hypothetical protein
MDIVLISPFDPVTGIETDVAVSAGITNAVFTPVETVTPG